MKFTRNRSGRYALGPLHAGRHTQPTARDKIAAALWVSGLVFAGFALCALIRVFA